MRFLRALWQLTGRRYPPWALLHSPEALGVDSLTFIELISELEEETGQCLDKFAAKLYRTKFCRWSGILKEMRREAMKEKQFFADDEELAVNAISDQRRGMEVKAVFRRYDLTWRMEDSSYREHFAAAYKTRVADTDVRLYFASELFRGPIMIREQSQKYDYTIFLMDKDCRLALHEDGRTLRVRQADGISYLLPQPYMIDGAGKLCHDVRYLLTEGEGYLLKILLNPHWMNEKERQLPISIIL